MFDMRTGPSDHSVLDCDPQSQLYYSCTQSMYIQFIGNTGMRDKQDFKQIRIRHVENVQIQKPSKLGIIGSVPVRGGKIVLVNGFIKKRDA
jgi:hypothetical protein